jgi:hypothetical protein
MAIRGSEHHPGLMREAADDQMIGVATSFVGTS